MKALVRFSLMISMYAIVVSGLAATVVPDLQARAHAIVYDISSAFEK